MSRTIFLDIYSVVAYHQEFFLDITQIVGYTRVLDNWFATAENPNANAYFFAAQAYALTNNLSIHPVTFVVICTFFRSLGSIRATVRTDVRSNAGLIGRGAPRFPAHFVAQRSDQEPGSGR